MPQNIKVNGAWKNVTNQYVKVGGVWKTVSAGYVKVAGVWKQFYSAISSVSVTYTAVAGGGGGGSSAGGGGGAGGFIEGTYSISDLGNYPIVIGAAGAVTTTNGNGFQGGNTTLFGLTALGGGLGTCYGGGSGGNGGSGGGGGAFSSGQGAGLTTQVSTYGYGFGNNGGTGYAAVVNGRAGSGGGAGGAGQNGTAGTSPGMPGGLGKASTINGTTYATGGRGGWEQTGQAVGVDAAANTGNGGEGTADNRTAGKGGSGIAIIRYTTGSMTATGGTITTSGGFTIHTFTANGTFTRTA